MNKSDCEIQEITDRTKKYTQEEIYDMRENEVKKLYERGEITPQQVYEYLGMKHYLSMAALFRRLY